MEACVDHALFVHRQRMFPTHTIRRHRMQCPGVNECPSLQLRCIISHADELCSQCLSPTLAKLTTQCGAEHHCMSINGFGPATKIRLGACSGQTIANHRQGSQIRACHVDRHWRLGVNPARKLTLGAIATTCGKELAVANSNVCAIDAVIDRESSVRKPSLHIVTHSGLANLDELPCLRE